MAQAQDTDVRKTEQIPQWKREEVDELTDILESYESVGIVSISGIPSKQLQDMRRELHGSAEVRVSRNTLLRRALGETGNEDLTEFVSGQVGIIGTDDNPFSLFKSLEESKTPAPISAGEVTPNEIVIPEGDTGVADGQFIGDLKQAGVDSRFMDGSVHVTERTVALETGETVSDSLASVLNALGIEPKEVGLDLRAVISDGVQFDPEDLDLDVEEYRDEIAAASSQAFNLAVNAAIPARGAVESILATAGSNARAVGLAGAVTEPGLMADLLARANADVRSLAAAIDDEDALPEELRGVEEPVEPESESGSESESESESQTEEKAGKDDTEEEIEAEDDDDDDDAAGDALGDMFG